MVWEDENAMLRECSLNRSNDSGVGERAAVEHSEALAPRHKMEAANAMTLHRVEMCTLTVPVYTGSVVCTRG